MYKALITDIDGTAVAISSDGSDIDIRTKDAVQNAIYNDKKLTCATGREWELAKNIISELGFTSPCIVEGGTRIVDPQTEATIWEKSLDKGIPAKVLKLFRSETTSGLIMHSSNTSRQKLEDVSILPDPLRFLYLLAIPEAIAITITARFL